MNLPTESSSSLADFFSSRPQARFLELLLVPILIISGVIAWAKALWFSLPPQMYQKDYTQEYLLAKAILSNMDPYQSVEKLGALFLSTTPVSLFPHPTPHPPPVIFIALPFGLLPYEQSQIAWFIFEAILFCVIIWQLMVTLPITIKTRYIILAIFAEIPILHFWEELAHGQLMLLILLLLIGAWKKLRRRQDLLGGVLLGLAIALKLIAWPTMILLICGRRWRAIFTATISLIAVNILAILIIGSPRVVEYYSEISGLVWSFYKSHIGNFSIFSIGWRLFEGTGSTILLGPQSPPILKAPAIAGLVSILCVTLWLVIGLTAAIKARSFDFAFGITTCVSVLASPITWSHYLVLLAIPMTMAAHRLVWGNKFSVSWAYLMVLMLFALSIPGKSLSVIVASFAIEGLTTEIGPTVPFTASLISMIPAAATILFLGLLRSMDAKTSDEDDPT